MTMEAAHYDPIDPQAIGPVAVRTAFGNQVAYCRDNGAPVTARICDALARLLDDRSGNGGAGAGAVIERLRAWDGPALADALPLRIAGGIHAIHLRGGDPGLSSVYDGGHQADPIMIIARVLRQYEAFLLPWLDGPPQTNEAGRSWAFAAAMLWLVDQGCPENIALFELGSSAGINLMMDRYRFNLGGTMAGPEDAVMQIAPIWNGHAPPQHRFAILSAEGCDVAPVDLTDPDQAMRLRAYIWPEMTERFARFEKAVAAASLRPPRITHARAGDYVRDVLARPATDGVTRLIVHSVVWQYIPRDEQDIITATIERAGAAATPRAPLAWAMLEANRDTHRHELTVRWWPDNRGPSLLAIAHPHGSWVQWQAP